MDNVITMARFGRLVLPVRIRKALQVTSPTAFKAEVMGNKVELTFVPPEGGRVINKRRGLLVVSSGGKKFNAAKAVGMMRAS